MPPSSGAPKSGIVFERGPTSPPRFIPPRFIPPIPGKAGKDGKFIGDCGTVITSRFKSGFQVIPGGVYEGIDGGVIAGTDGISGAGSKEVTFKSMTCFLIGSHAMRGILGRDGVAGISADGGVVGETGINGKFDTGVGDVVVLTSVDGKINSEINFSKDGVVSKDTGIGGISNAVGGNVKLTGGGITEGGVTGGILTGGGTIEGRFTGGGVTGDNGTPVKPNDSAVKEGIPEGEILTGGRVTGGTGGIFTGGGVTVLTSTDGRINSGINFRNQLISTSGGVGKLTEGGVTEGRFTGGRGSGVGNNEVMFKSITCPLMGSHAMRGMVSFGGVTTGVVIGGVVIGGVVIGGAVIGGVVIGGVVIDGTVIGGGVGNSEVTFKSITAPLTGSHTIRGIV